MLFSAPNESKDHFGSKQQIFSNIAFGKSNQIPLGNDYETGRACTILRPKAKWAEWLKVGILAWDL
jgi:hypothetical protein